MKPPVPYPRFCDDRQERWTEHARLVDALHGGSSPSFDDLERLAALQHAVASDLSAVRTWFPGSRAAQRLTRQAIQGARVLRPPSPPLANRLWDAWSRWPRSFRAALPGMATASFVFGLGVGLGALLSRQSDAAALAFVGEDALTAVQAGELWTDWVAFEAPAPVLALAIALNNAAVGLLAWASGILLGVGSLYVVLTNGLMVGTIFAMAHRYGVLDRMVAFTAAHGPLELTLVVVCGGAGVSFAQNMLRDDGQPRGQRITEAAQDSLHVVLGTLPGFALLGAVEGFISPNMDVPTEAKALLGALLFAVFVLLVTFGGRRPQAPEARAA